MLCLASNHLLWTNEHSDQVFIDNFGVRINCFYKTQKKTYFVHKNAQHTKTHYD